MPDLDHLVATGFTQPKDFRSPLSVRQNAPDRNRQQHGAGLLAQLRGLAAQAEALRGTRIERGVDPGQGIAIALEISPPGSIDSGKKLEWKRDGIEILNVTNPGNSEVVTVFVPDGKLAAFEKRVSEYLYEDRPSSDETAVARPKHASLINAISSFRRAAFTELWTDTAPVPLENVAAFFTVWLRLGATAAVEVAGKFREVAERLDIAMEPGHITFPGRVVVAVHATRSQLEQSTEILDLVAEIRSTAPSAAFYISELRPYEQVEWVRNLLDRTTLTAGEDGPFVTLLDTGVNRGHPLLQAFVDDADLHAVRPEWLVIDRAGHGSNMAGIALHGDLRGPLSGQAEHVVNHRLESVKILPDAGANPPRLYGWTASEAVRLVEAAAAGRKRTFAMMTTSSGATAGMPSEWSATIDRLAFGLNGDSITSLDLPAVEGNKPILKPRLFVLAAGNIPWTQWHEYPARNDLETIEDPAQA